MWWGPVGAAHWGARGGGLQTPHSPARVTLTVVDTLVGLKARTPPSGLSLWAQLPQHGSYFGGEGTSRESLAGPTAFRNFASAVKKPGVLFYFILLFTYFICFVLLYFVNDGQVTEACQFQWERTDVPTPDGSPQGLEEHETRNIRVALSGKGSLSYQRFK